MNHKLHRILGHWQPRQFPIAYKLALSFTLFIGTGMTLLGLLIIDKQAALLQQQMVDAGNALIQQMSESAVEPMLANDSVVLSRITGSIVSNDTVSGAALLNDQATIITQSGIPLAADFDVNQPAPFEWRHTEPGADRLPLITFTHPIVFKGLTVGYAVLSFDHSRMLQAKQEAIRTVIFTTLLLIIIGIIVSILLGRRLTRPIYQLIDVSDEISRGNLGIRLTDRRNDELGKLMDSLNTMSEGLLKKQQVEQVFSRFVPKNVATEVMNDLENIELGGRRVEASVVFADIVGFTQLAEDREPQQVSAMLNNYFSPIAEAAHHFNGHVDKYIGDCAMLVFGVPVADEDHRLHAVSCALLIHRIVELLNERIADHPPLQFRIGINSGTMLAGNMGSRERMEYTVVGDAVNLASRLASAAQPLQTIITSELAHHPSIRDHCHIEEQSTIEIRGMTRPVTTYNVESLRDAQQALEDIAQAIIINPN